MNVSVVIRSYNEAAHLGRLLDGLSKQTVVPSQIILVDSGSTDETVAIALAHGVEVHTIDKAVFSFGRSLNVGCRAATGEVLVIASAHVFPVYDSWIERLVAPLADTGTALAYGRQVGDQTTKFSEHQVLAKWFPERSVARQDNPFCNNANAAVRREIWAAQPYDESLTGLEDMDWGKRAMERGFAVAYVAEAPVVHLHDETPRQIANRYRREAIAHRRIFHDQGLSIFDALRLTAANVVADYARAIRERVLLRNLAEIPMFRSAQFWGAYKGFRQRGPVSESLKRHFYYPRQQAVGRDVVEGEHGRRIEYGHAQEGLRVGRD